MGQWWDASEHLRKVPLLLRQSHRKCWPLLFFWTLSSLDAMPKRAAAWWGSQQGRQSEPGQLQGGAEAYSSWEVSVMGDRIYPYCLNQCEFSVLLLVIKCTVERVREFPGWWQWQVSGQWLGSWGGNQVSWAGEQRTPGGMTPMGKSGTSRFNYVEKCLERWSALQSYWRRIFNHRCKQINEMKK